MVVGMDLAHELHDLVRTLDREAERLLRGEGMTYHRFVALVIVAEHPGITGRRLASAVGVSEPSMSVIVRRLLDDGHVVDLSEGVGRARRLAATEAGRSTLGTCRRVLGDALDGAARSLGLDPQELARTVRALHDAVRLPAPPTNP